MSDPIYKIGQPVRISPKVTGRIVGILEGNKYLVKFIDPEFGAETTTSFAESDIEPTDN